MAEEKVIILTAEFNVASLKKGDIFQIKPSVDFRALKANIDVAHACGSIGMIIEEDGRAADSDVLTFVALKEGNFKLTVRATSSETGKPLGKPETFGIMVRP